MTGRFPNRATAIVVVALLVLPIVLLLLAGLLLAYLRIRRVEKTSESYAAADFST